MIKILYIGMSSNMGGIEKYLINLYRYKNKKKFQINFLVFAGERPCFYEEIKEDLLYMRKRTKNYLGYLKDLKTIFTQNEFDFIHFNLMNFSCFEGIIMSRKYSKAKIILHSHIADNNLYSKKTKLLSTIGEKIVLQKQNYLLCACSRKAGLDMFKNFQEKEITVLNNSIELEKFYFSEKARAELRKKLGLNENIRLIGHIGRFVEQKNHKLIISIFDEVLKKDKNYRLMLIGNGFLKEKIKTEAKTLGIIDKIIFLENIENIQDYLSCMDVFLFPSLFEGFGIVLLEAQANGLPCIIANNLPEEVKKSNNITELSLKDTPNKWAKKIIERSNIELKERNKYNKKLEEFKIEKTVEKLENYYERNKESHERKNKN